jgi:hypothetical protein
MVGPIRPDTTRLKATGPTQHAMFHLRVVTATSSKARTRSGSDQVVPVGQV